MPIAAGNAALVALSDLPRSVDEARKSPNGWDPYEVWRTRVLLPRLEEKQLTMERSDTLVKPFLVHSA